MVWQAPSLSKFNIRTIATTVETLESVEWNNAGMEYWNGLNCV